jgi:hypothetical protein
MAQRSTSEAVDAAGSEDDHQRALRLMSLYAPLVHVVPTAEVLAGR